MHCGIEAFESHTTAPARGGASSAPPGARAAPAAHAQYPRTSCAAAALFLEPAGEIIPMHHLLQHNDSRFELVQLLGVCLAQLVDFSAQ